MIKYLKTTLALAICCAAPAFADTTSETHRKAAEEMLVLLEFKETFLTTSNASHAAVLDQLRAQQMPEHLIVKVKAALDEFTVQVVEDPSLYEQMVDLYCETFTEEELKDLVTFYSTPLGRKTLDTMPILFQRGAEIGAAAGRKHQAALEANLMAIFAEAAQEQEAALEQEAAMQEEAEAVEAVPEAAE